jgi:hypothetical protein
MALDTSKFIYVMKKCGFREASFLGETWRTGMGNVPKH